MFRIVLHSFESFGVPPTGFATVGLVIPCGSPSYPLLGRRAKFWAAFGSTGACGVLTPQEFEADGGW